MTEFEKRVLDELADLRRMVESLKSQYSLSQITYFENLPASAAVGADYVAYRFGISEPAVVRGRFETNRIPKLRNKPVTYIKRDVDAVWLNLNKPISEAAAEYRHKANQNLRRKKTNYE